jgi:hypothetical protein
MDELRSPSLSRSPTPLPSPPFNWENAPHVDVSLVDIGGEMGNTFDETLQMAIGEPNDNFIPPKEVDFHGMRESSCEEFSGQEDDVTYYDAEEDLQQEALFRALELLHAPADDSVRLSWDVEDFLNYYESASIAHAGPSHNGGGSCSAGCDPVGCDGLGDYSNDEGTALGCESEGGAWEEVHVTVSVHAWGGVRVAPQWWGRLDSVGFEQGIIIGKGLEDRKGGGGSGCKGLGMARVELAIDMGWTLHVSIHYMERVRLS